MTDQEMLAIDQTPEAFGTYAEDEPVSKEQALDDLEAMGEFIPVVGDAIDVKNVSKALREGEYGEAAMAGLGFVPFVGGALKRGAKATMELFRGADKKIQEEALALTAKQLERIPNPNSERDVSALLSNAALIEQQKINIERAVRQRQTGTSSEERADWLTRDRNNPSLYHATRGGDRSASSIEREGLSPQPHSELGVDSSSTSRDPIYSTRHFGRDDTSNLFEVRMTPEERARLHNVRPEEYEYAKETKGEEGLYLMGEDASGINIPKTPAYRSEHESALFTPEAADIERLSKTNPEKAEWIQEGVDKANDVRANQDALREALKDMMNNPESLTPAQAKQLYNDIRDNMRSALSLAKYTEDNSARGTYDWYISNWAKKDSPLDADMPDSYYDMDLDTPQDWEMDMPEGDVFDPAEALNKLADMMPGEQNAANLRNMAESIDMYGDPEWMSTKEFGEAARAAKQYDPVRSALQDRAAKIAELKALMDDGQITPEVFKQDIKRITEEYKPLLQAAKKEGRAEPRGFIPTTERMNKGGLVN